MQTQENVWRTSSSTPITNTEPTHWTLALAGGEGVRLQEYVQRRLGKRIPKQYCALLGERSMLEHTLWRFNRVTPASRTLTVIGTDHAAYAMPQVRGLSDHVFRQPASRNTGIAVYVALAMIKRWSPRAVVTITPTDHYVDPEERFIQQVCTARQQAMRLRDVVILLGVRPTEPDPELGYLRLGDRMAPSMNRLSGFVEKPSVTRAQELIGCGALWNTMVTCGTVDALWELGRMAEPHLIDILDSLVPLVGTPDESDALEYIYRAYLPVSFSHDILERTKHKLAAIELADVEWSDWGKPERVETALAMRRHRASVSVAN